MVLSVVPVVLLVLLQAHSNDAQAPGAQGIVGTLQLAAIAGIGLLGAGGFALGLLISQGDQVKVYSEELPPVYPHHAQAEEDSYSDSYGAPSHGYGAPSYKPEPSSSYGAPSYKQPGDGYGAPEAPVYGPPDYSYRSRRGRRAVTEAARTAEAEAIIAMLVDMEPEHCYKMVICAASTGQ